MKNRKIVLLFLCQQLLEADMEIKPIAIIHTPFKEKFGIPRQSGKVATKSTVVFEKEYRNPDSLKGIEGFSHLWLIFDFSKAHRDEFCATVRPPRLGGNTKMGVFATRSPFRPNSLGLSLVKLVGVEDTKQGKALIVEGADILDGTPIYDIKPYLKTDCVPSAVCGFAEDITHLLKVENVDVLGDLQEDVKQEIVSCIAQDPRPSYQDDDRIYGMIFDCYNVRFTVKDGVATILDYRRSED